uniref:Inhibitor of growth protein N-terminal histone-binding domain-containing protein n=1 Tax=Ditylenchus dipsaci TaxID=166011 RepID=A0A915EAZ6_9BILA
MHYLEDDLELLEGTAELKSHSLIGRERRCAKIRETYKVIREMSEEKLAIAEYLHLMLEKYQERIAKDLTEFKYELEADTAGVTDGIEKELGESIKTASASRRTVRPVLGNQLATVAEHDSNLEDIKPPGGLSNTQSSSTNMYRMNGHRHPSSSSETHSQSDERSRVKNLLPLRNTILYFCCSPVAMRLPPSLNFSSEEKSAKTNCISYGFQSASAASLGYLWYQKDIPSIPALLSCSYNCFIGWICFSECQSSTTPFQLSKHCHSFGRYHWRKKWWRRAWGNRPLVGQPSNEIAQKIDPSSSSSSESTYQQPHSIPSAQPAFAGQAESQSSYGRPVKLTSRVQQMLKDRQIQGHRVMWVDHQLVYSASTSSSSSYSNNSNYGQSASQDQQYLDEEADEEDVKRWEKRTRKLMKTLKIKTVEYACDNKSCPYEWFHYSCVE